MRQPRRLFGLQDIVILVAGFSLTWVQMANFAIDPGVGWHLATGEYILKHESIPRVDPFLASAAPRPWIADQWLADVLLFSLYAIGSWPLLYGVLAATYLATFYLILYPLTVRMIGAPLLAIGATMLASKLGWLHFILRPVIFGFFCFAALTALVWRRDIARRTADGGHSSRWWPLEPAIIPLFIVWANLHPSFALGIAFLALRPIAHLLDRLIGTAKNLDWLAVRLACRDLAWAILASCMNPYGVALHRSIIELGMNRYFMSLHEEWLPPNLAEGIGFVLPVVILLFGLSALSERTPRSFRSFELLVFSVFAWLALGAVRILPFFAIATVVPLARSLAHHTVITPNARGLRGKFRAAWERISSREMRSTRGVVSTTLLCLLLCLDPLLRGRVLFFDGPFGPPTLRFPYGAVRILADTATPTNPVVVVAPPEWGGFITGFGGEFVHPIIDDRNTLLGAPFYLSFEAALRPDGPWERYLIEHTASFILLPSLAPLNQQLEKNLAFELLYRDSVGVLYRRRALEANGTDATPEPAPQLPTP